MTKKIHKFTFSENEYELVETINDPKMTMAWNGDENVLTTVDIYAVVGEKKTYSDIEAIGHTAKGYTLRLPPEKIKEVVKKSKVLATKERNHVE